MSKSDRKKLKLAYIVLIIAAAIGLAVVVWLAWVRPAQESADIQSYQECVEAGYPVQESSPEVCVTPDGTRFENPNAPRSGLPY
jgi:hypothetical protein